jgi:chromosome partitioning protein
VVPVSPDFLSSIGIALLLSRIKKLSEDLENPLVHVGIVISRVGRTSYFRTQTAQTLRTLFKDMVFDTQITERTAVAQSAAQNRPIFQMTENATAAIDEFTKFGAEMAGKLSLK